MKKTVHRKVQGAPKGLPVFPVSLLVAGKRCLVVGGGAVAFRKIGHLLDAGAEVAVVCLKAEPEIAVLAEEKNIRLQLRAFENADVSGAFLAFAATDDAVVNAQVLTACRNTGVLCCAVDKQWPDGNFVTPATFRADDVTVSVSTGGRSCRQARVIKAALARQVGLVATADLLVVGVSHESLALAERERFHAAAKDLEATGLLVAQIRGVHEFMLLNTCNRVELIAVAAQQDEVVAAVQRILGFDHLPADAHYVRRGYAAFEHVALLTAGLLSQTPGEGHITRQIKDALAAATRAKWADTMLAEWLSSSLHISRHIRENTARQLKQMEIEDICFAYLKHAGTKLSGRHVMVIGSGVVGSALIERCRANGMQATWAYHSHRPALSRTAGKEIGLCAFERIPENIGKMDAIFCATSGTTPVLQAGLAPFFKPGKPVLVMDLAVPRSVAPELPKRCPGVRLVDMDTLKQWWHREQAVLTDVLASGRQAVREHVVMYEKHVQSFQGRNQR